MNRNIFINRHILRRMKILVVLPRFPYPLEKGDKLRAFHQIRMLSKNNEIYLFCLTHTRVLDEHVEAVKPFCKDICIVQSPKLVNYKNIIRNYFLTKSLQLGYWDSLKVRKAFKSYPIVICLLYNITLSYYK